MVESLSSTHKGLISSTVQEQRLEGREGGKEQKEGKGRKGWREGGKKEGMEGERRGVERKKPMKQLENKMHTSRSQT